MSSEMPGSIRSGDKEARRRFAIVIEKAEKNYSAYVPDLPGCVATGDSLASTKNRVREAIAFHLEGMREDGLPIPEARTSVAWVEVDGVRQRGRID